jgi:hypothetical protein
VGISIPTCGICLAVPAFEIDQRFTDQNRIVIFIFKSDREFIFLIAIVIPIKNRSGKIANRFSLSGYFDTHLRDLPGSSRI